MCLTYFEAFVTIRYASYVRGLGILSYEIAVRSYVITALWAHVINVHLPVFDATALSWTFAGFHPKLGEQVLDLIFHHCQVWMHLSCKFEWLGDEVFPGFFSPPQKRGGFKTHGISNMTIDRPQGPAGRLWKVNYLECDMEVTVVPRGPGVGRVLGKTKRRVVSLKRWLWEYDIFFRKFPNWWIWIHI